MNSPLRGRVASERVCARTRATARRRREAACARTGCFTAGAAAVFLSCVASFSTRGAVRPCHSSGCRALLTTRACSPHTTLSLLFPDLRCNTHRCLRTHIGPALHGALPSLCPPSFPHPLLREFTTANPLRTPTHAISRRGLLDQPNYYTPFPLPHTRTRAYRATHSSTHGAQRLPLFSSAPPRRAHAAFSFAASYSIRPRPSRPCQHCGSCVLPSPFSPIPPVLPRGTSRCPCRACALPRALPIPTHSAASQLRLPLLLPAPFALSSLLLFCVFRFQPP